MIGKGLVFLGAALPALATELVKRQSGSLDSCPGYTASNVQDDGGRVTANLALAGTACNVYGDDLTDLRLEVEYQTRMWPFPLSSVSMNQDTDPLQKTGFTSRSTMPQSRSSRSKNLFGPAPRVMMGLIPPNRRWCFRTRTARSRSLSRAGTLTRRFSTLQPRAWFLKPNTSVSGQACLSLRTCMVWENPRMTFT